MIFWSSHIDTAHVTQQLAACLPVQELCFTSERCVAPPPLSDTHPFFSMDDARVLFLEDHFVASSPQALNRHDREPAHHDVPVGHRSCSLFELLSYLFRTQLFNPAGHICSCTGVPSKSRPFPQVSSTDSAKALDRTVAQAVGARVDPVPPCLHRGVVFLSGVNAVRTSLCPKRSCLSLHLSTWAPHCLQPLSGSGDDLHLLSDFEERAQPTHVPDQVSRNMSACMCNFTNQHFTSS